MLDLGDPRFLRVLDGTPPELGALLSYGLAGMAARLLSRDWPADARLPRSEVTLLAPLPRPPLILGVAHNYHDAVAERGMAPPSEPVVFEKADYSVIGPDEPIVLPPSIGGVTYEGELAVVLGRSAHDVPSVSAMEYVAGYMAFNDVSASELIRSSGSLERGKNFRTFGPLGPCLVTADEVPEPHALSLITTVDGRRVQDSNTAQLICGVADLVSRLSHVRRLPVGTIIATGTPAGVAPLQSPPTWLTPGSMVTISLENVGELTNPVVQGECAYE
ncbi:MAG: fumarylacetoacetate hydrolase family protein [Gammaproteobacteria bacterium]|nr:fumarylacetoacetate hydrolase family protein [Gammaproteobacteria bacterium]